MARLNARKYFTDVTVQGFLLLFFGELLELGSSPTVFLRVLPRGEDADLFGDGNSGLLGVTGNHNDRNTSRSAGLNGALNFFSWGIFDCHVSKENAVAFEVVVLTEVASFITAVSLGDVSLVATVRGVGDAENTESKLLLFNELLLNLVSVSFRKVGGYSVERDGCAFSEHTVTGSLKEDGVLFVAFVAGDDCRHGLALRAELKGADFSSFSLNFVKVVKRCLCFSVLFVIFGQFGGKTLKGSFSGGTGHFVSRTIRHFFLLKSSEGVERATSSHVAEVGVASVLLLGHTFNHSLRVVGVLLHLDVNDVADRLSVGAELSGTHLIFG